MYFAELEGKVVYFRLQMLSLSEPERSGLPLLLLMKLGFGGGGRDPEWASGGSSTRTNFLGAL